MISQFEMWVNLPTRKGICLKYNETLTTCTVGYSGMSDGTHFGEKIIITKADFYLSIAFNLV